MSEQVEGATTWQEVRLQASEQLARAGVEDAKLEARRLIEGATGSEGAEYVLVLEELVTVNRLASFDAMLARRLAGEPLQYVLGNWGFRTLDLAIDARVLIPRPETEVVAGIALSELSKFDLATAGEPLIAVDLGTGSGAIGLCLAAETETVDVWLTDVSPGAIQVARANLAGLGGRVAPRVRIAEGSWFAALPDELRGRVGLIVTNPPYVSSEDLLPAAVSDWEPLSALFSGEDGLDDIRVIVAGAPEWLRPGGCLVIEHAPSQAGSISELVAEAGFAKARVDADQYGLLRVLVAHL